MCYFVVNITSKVLSAPSAFYFCATYLQTQITDISFSISRVTGGEGAVSSSKMGEADVLMTEEAGEMQQVGVDVRELVRSQCSRGAYTYDVRL